MFGSRGCVGSLGSGDGARVQLLAENAVVIGFLEVGQFRVLVV